MSRRLFPRRIRWATPPGLTTHYSTCRGGMPVCAATFAPDRPRGFRPTAAAAAPAIFWMQRIGRQSWGPSCWLPEVQGSDSTAALGPHRASRWRELLRSLVCSVALDGEVIWKGSGCGESTPARIHAMDCVNAPVDRNSDQGACAATTELAAQPTLPLGRAYGKAPWAQTRRSGPHRGVNLSAM